MPVEIFIFILTIIPGFLALSIYWSKHPIKRPSDFVFTTSSIIIGSFITIIFLVFDQYFFFDVFQTKQVIEKFLSSSNSDQLKSETIIMFTVGQLLSGILFGIFFYYLRELYKYFQLKEWKYFKFIHYRPEPWMYINEQLESQWHRIYINDDLMYIGTITYYSKDPNLIDYAFILSNANLYRFTNGLYLKIDEVIPHIYLNTRDIKRIEFLDLYEPKKTNHIESIP